MPRKKGTRFLIFVENDNHLINNKQSFKEVYCSSNAVKYESYLSIGIEYFVDADVFVKSPRKALGDPDAISQMLANSR